MAATQGEINKELFKRINSLERVASELSGYFKGMVDNTKELIGLMRSEQKHHKVVVGILATLLAFCIAALVYGAIGDKGLHSVRQTMPLSVGDAITAGNDFDRWMYFHGKHVRMSARGRTFS